jgi:hypothetical protein
MATGWEWSRIQIEQCPFCGLDPARIQRGLLGSKLLDEADSWRLFLTETSIARLRRRAESGMFTPLENGAHVRDMLLVFGDRIKLALAEDGPLLPWFDPGRAEDDYNHIDPVLLAVDIEAQATRLAEILVQVKPTDWDRIGTRAADPRVECSKGDTFTVIGMACYALHEAHCHLLNARLGSDISR